MCFSLVNPLAVNSRWCLCSIWPQNEFHLGFFRSAFSPHFLYRFAVLHVFLTPAASSFVRPHAQGSLAVWDSEGLILSPLSTAIVVLVYIVGGPLVVVALHVSVSWTALISLSLWVSLFVVCSTSENDLYSVSWGVILDSITHPLCYTYVYSSLIIAKTTWVITGVVKYSKNGQNHICGAEIGETLNVLSP